MLIVKNRTNILAQLLCNSLLICVYSYMKEKVMWFFVMDIFRTFFKVCSCIYGICSHRKRGKCECWTIL